ncbi:MAG: outer membrane protein assembly factor BamB [Verrucomicrobiales bacterium]|jgi:outer membrane protein assembly factor BamB
MRKPTLLLLCLATPILTIAEDWPMWRGDPQRSGSSTEQLPADLHPQWTRQLPEARIAWANESRLHFDASYHPVVTGKKLIIASPNDGSVAAFDTETGSEGWRFFTDGPVRVAPVAMNGKVYVGSDDGYLYCLSSESGEMLWKIRAAPEDRPEYRHLGNGRLVSFWPVRGGPVIADGKLYFGSGIWPTMGVFVFAANPETGELIWTNSNSHQIPDTRIDHNKLHEAGISPQGHMLVAGDRLIVANGRSMPARLDKETGELLHFVQGYRNGDSRVIVSGDLALVGERGVMDLTNGLEMGAVPYTEAGKEAPQGWDGGKMEQFEGPLFQYKFFKGCDHRSVVHEGIAYGAETGVVYAYDLANSEVERYEKENNGKTIKPAKWEAPLAWTYQGRVGEKNAQSTPNTILKSGDRLYTHWDKLLIAIDIETKELAWEVELPDIPAELIAADGKLFAVTENGGVHCFGAREGESQTYEAAAPEIASADDSEPPAVLAAAGVNEGYALVLGVEDGELIEGLLRHSELRVIAVDSDRTKIDDLRRRFALDGPWDARFQAIADDPKTVKIAPYLGSLITSETAGLLTADERIFEMLHPYGGTAYFDEKIRRREGPLPGSASWTQETGDAARSFFSRDQLVKAPLGILWYGDGVDHGFYKRKDYGHGVKPQVAGGRLFALQVASNTLHAVDCYTGRLLWTKKVEGSARYASWPDAVFVAQGRELVILDAETGETMATHPLEIGQPDDIPVRATEVRIAEDTVLIGLRFKATDQISEGRWDCDMIVAVDRRTGKQRWAREAGERFGAAAVAMAKGKVFCIDSHSPIEIAEMNRRGADSTKLTSTIFALDEKTGAELWRYTLDNPPAVLKTIHFLGLRSSDDWLACTVDKNLLIGGKNERTVALNLDSGEMVWERDSKGQQPLIITGDTFINQVGHTYETATGKVLDGSRLFTRGGCNYAVGSENLLFLRDNCAAYIDIKSGEQTNLRNLRSGCSASLIAADGVLNSPCFSVGCVCNYPIQTSFSMVHMPETGSWQVRAVEPED